MIRILGALRHIPILIFCTFLSIAVVRVYEAEKVKLSQLQLPTPVGQRYAEPSFAAKVRTEVSVVWIEFYHAIFPELVPKPPEVDRRNPNTLDALQSRTRRKVSSYAEIEY